MKAGTHKIHNAILNAVGMPGTKPSRKIANTMVEAIR